VTLHEEKGGRGQEGRSRRRGRVFYPSSHMGEVVVVRGGRGGEAAIIA